MHLQTKKITNQRYHNLIHRYLIDYMHAFCHGITKYMKGMYIWNFLFNNSLNDEFGLIFPVFVYYNSRNIVELD